jgi:hypothetical protein
MGRGRPGKTAAFFDASRTLPEASAVLELAVQTGIEKGALARAIGGAATQDEAAGNLARLGLIKPGRYAPLDLKYMLLRLWYESAPAPKMDGTWAVPALVASKGGVTYYVHGVAHGQIRPAGRSRVLSLVRGLEAEGKPLYSEENFPMAYGFSWGKETLDHASEGGSPAALAEARERAGSPAALLLRRALNLALSPGSLLIPLPALLSDPSSALAWTALAALAAFNFSVETSMLPWQRLLSFWYARQAEAIGEGDMAHHLRAYARLVQRGGADASDALRVELPMPLKAEESSGSTLRSKAMAEAIARDAAESRAKEVHVLAGLNHAQELAWNLSQ